MQKIPNATEVINKVTQAAFGRPLITNVLRGQVAEAIVALALEPEWQWCAEDYSSWDFERSDGLRLEVKQSAARQSWATSDKPSACSFDIAERKGRWEGPVWIKQAGRFAQIYIFAHHPLTGLEADHRNPDQWRFFVVPTHKLPATQRLSLSRANSLSAPLTFQDLACAVRQEAETLGVS